MTMEAFGVGIGTNLATDLIKGLFSLLRSAVRCKDACEELEQKLVVIENKVNGITRQLNQIDMIEPNSKQAVGDWLSELKEELEAAKIVVHHCTSGSKVGRHFNVYKNSKLTKEIKAHCEKITRLAERSVDISLHLGRLVSASSSEGSRMFAQWSSQKNDILHREDSTRLSERYFEFHQNSVHQHHQWSYQ